MKKKRSLRWIYYILIVIGIIIFLEGFLGVISSFVHGLSLIVAGVVSISAEKRSVSGENNKKKNLELGLIIGATVCLVIMIVMIALNIISDPIVKVLVPLVMILIAYNSWKKANKLVKNK